MSRSVLVRRAGWCTTVQDLGRRGLAHLAVPPSGHLHREAALLANRLVGNPPEVAVLETTGNGVALEAGCMLVTAVSGAPAEVRVSGRSVPWACSVLLRPGDVLEVGPAQGGLRSYVALDGGIDVPPVLGSRSSDLLSGLGPSPLADGDELPLGARPTAPPRAGDIAAVGWPGLARPAVLRARLGPRHDCLAPGGVGQLARAVLHVEPESDRSGLRLAGSRLRSVLADELPSEGMVQGAVQLWPSGRLVVLLADHPTTGGYPVIAVVDPEDLWIAGQLRPGDELRLALASPVSLG